MSCCAVSADPGSPATGVQEQCFHCQGPIPPASVDSGSADAGPTDSGPGANRTESAAFPASANATVVTIDGSERRVCGAACARAAHAIISGGLTDYYRLRSGRPAAALAPDSSKASLTDNAVFDDERVQDGIVETLEGGLRSVQLIVEGMRCAGCVWVTERSLREVPGVREASINYATRRARVVWDPAEGRLGEVLDRVATLGYSAFPYDPGTREALLATERRRALERLGIGAAFGMQVMMVTFALYAGDFTGMALDMRALLTWVGAVLTVPVLVYAARPFFIGAWRDLRAGRIGMDVPIALGMSLAYAGSLHAAWTGTGEVYFDSVVMFTLLLLLARYVEARVTRRGSAHLDEQLRAMPSTVRRVSDDGAGTCTILAAEVEPGEHIEVRPGEIIAVDGVILNGTSGVDEALLTGESDPRLVGVGDSVLGGSVNGDGPLVIRVEREARSSLLSRIVAMVDRAAAERPPMVALAERVASRFLLAVLTLAVCVAFVWYLEDSTRWIPVTVAVLVATCPCALSLAMPAAHAAASASLVRHGLVPTTGSALEALASVTHVVLDKTGTLTRGAPSVTHTWFVDPGRAAHLADVAIAIERKSEHPVARAIVALGAADRLPADEVCNSPGQGLAATVAGQRWYLGTAEYVRRQTGHCPAPGTLGADAVSATHAWLACADGVVAGFACRDRLRDDAHALVQSLQGCGLDVRVLSGDREAVVAEVAAALGLTNAHGALDPDQKLARVRDLQGEGARVLAIGDGINDAPLLAAADVSVAMGSGSLLARTRADWVLMNDRLGQVADGLVLARRTARVVRQNFGWAVGYNLLVLPAAALGALAPWQAAIGMSVSSLLVVLNATRLAASGRPADSGADAGHASAVGHSRGGSALWSPAPGESSS